ncbi:putative NBD/HSP70 family sugar kinase [Pullulanibacillus pueri]|uniref:Transcriptional regulator n=1 Tax=Pullulanibacillus pueri TaxID=1437324 RepID=A0A8J2ZY74_9BACL|nr:ROK family transcriptional regulator [Pullulanibacillus pueri]MBM7683337.1 putative NBD/HSP70 family sugar kinase [Pullulanibacillus pueri]GGH86355.1 transcriptional regulator [Pullulanibacillus pueri]
MKKGPALLREVNKKRVLAYLRTHNVSSRQEITESLGLSKNTVSLIIDEFHKQGVISEVGIDSIGVGRPRKKIAINPNIFFSVGVHIRHYSIEVVVTNYLGTIVDSRTIKVEIQDPDHFFKEIEMLWSELEKKYETILGLGIAVPGLVDPEQGLLHYSVHLGWENVNFVERLESLSVPIQVFNRVKAAALSPVKVIPEGAESTFYLRIDEGVGGALVLNNDILNGFSNTAGEIGHLSIQADGPLCSCGQHGCLERLVSLPFVVEELKERGVHLLYDEEQTKPLSELLFIQDGFKALNQVMEEIGQHTGAGLATIINLFNPQYIVVDSPYNGIEAFKQSTLSSMMNKALSHPAKHANLVFASPSLSSAWGMALAVITKFETPKR